LLIVTIALKDIIFTIFKANASQLIFS